MMKIDLKGEKGSIVIDILGYERSNANDISDANWLVSKAEIYVGIFSGQLELSLTTQDLVRFNKMLDGILKNLSGSATFHTDEDKLYFLIEMKSLGNAEVSGTVRDFVTNTELRFCFNTDQSYLANTKLSLNAAIEEFPEIKDSLR